MLLLQIQDFIISSADSINLNTTIEELSYTLNAINNSVDSISSKLTQTVENTRPHPYSVWGLRIAIIGAAISFIGAVISFFAMHYSKKGAYFSKETAMNVERAGRNTQLLLLEDLIRHLYRNKVVTHAMILKMRDEKGKYPSEQHFLKLKTLPEDIHLDRYNNDADHYFKMHGISILLRNYNTEIEVIQRHLSDPNTEEAVREKDMNDLLFKPLYLIYKISDAISMIEQESSSKKEWQNTTKKIGKSTAIKIMFSEHFDKLYENISKKEEWLIQENIIKSKELLSGKDEEWISILTINKELFKLKDILCEKKGEKENYFLGDNIKQMIEKNNIDTDFAKLICEELGFNSENTSLKNKLFDHTFNAKEIFPRILSRDVSIEYGKITMREYLQTIKKRLS